MTAGQDAGQHQLQRLALADHRGLDGVEHRGGSTGGIGGVHGAGLGHLSLPRDGGSRWRLCLAPTVRDTARVRDRGRPGPTEYVLLRITAAVELFLRSRGRGYSLALDPGRRMRRPLLYAPVVVQRCTDRFEAEVADTSPTEIEVGPCPSPS